MLECIIDNVTFKGFWGFFSGLLVDPEVLIESEMEGLKGISGFREIVILSARLPLGFLKVSAVFGWVCKIYKNPGINGDYFQEDQVL